MPVVRRTRQLSNLVLGLSVVPTTMLVAAWLAPLFWWADLLAVFAVQVAACLLATCVVLAWARRWRWLAAVGALAAVSCIRLSPMWFGTPGGATSGAPLRLLAINLLRDNDDAAAVLAAVAQWSPDVIVWSEATPAWERALTPLRKEYAFGDGKWDPGYFGIVLWSRLPVRDLRIVPLGFDWAPAVTAIVATPAGEVGVVGFHPPRPGVGQRTAERDAALAALPELLTSLPARRVVAGDGNATRWNPTFARMLAVTGLRDSSDGFGWQATWPAALPWFLRIPIDQVLVGGAIGVRRREVGPFVGSDHLPVFAELWVPAEGAPGTSR